MKISSRLLRYKTPVDQTSAFLNSFRFQIEYFTCWPQQDHKTLKNLVSTYIKLILQISGVSEVDSLDSHFTLESGDCVLVPPYAVYSARTHEQVCSYELFFNVYPITREQEFLHQLGFTSTLHIPGLIIPTDSVLLGDCCEAAQMHREGCYAQLGALLELLLVRMIRSRQTQISASGVSPRVQSTVERLFAYLDEHLNEDVRVEDVCGALSVSQTFLYRCCRSVMDCSPSQVITRYKLSHARTLLRNPDLSIGEVAAAIGYNPYYFSSQFKKSFLLSPSAYRKELSKG